MITIVTPTYNSEEYLEQCILSIKSQSYMEYEHIIVDGGSKDSTLDIIRKYDGTYPMRWISEKDNGMYDAICKGFQMAKGDICCWLNSDDIYMPWTLEAVTNIFNNKEIQWCTGIPAHIDETGVQYFDTVSKVIYPQYAIKRGWMDGRKLGCIQQESTFWRKSLYTKADGLNSYYKLAGDFFLWRAFSQYAKLYTANSVLAAFRVHKGQKSGDKEAYWNEIGKISFCERLGMKCGAYKWVNFVLKTLNKDCYIDLRNY